MPTIEPAVRAEEPAPAAEASRFLGDPLPFLIDAAERRAFQLLFNQLPAMIHLEARIDVSDDRLVSVFIDRMRPFHRGGMGGEAVNGGVLSSLLDCALGAAGVLHLGGWKGDRRSGTVELSVQMLRQVHGSRVLVRGGVVKKAAQFAFGRAEVIDEAGRVCTTATGIVVSA